MYVYIRIRPYIKVSVKFLSSPTQSLSLSHSFNFHESLRKIWSLQNRSSSSIGLPLYLRSRSIISKINALRIAILLKYCETPPESAMPLTRSKSLPSTDAITENGGSDRQNLSSGRSVAGILHKWTNYGKGWRSRWFLLRDGTLSYSKIRRPENVNLLSPSDDVRLIGDNSTDRLSRMYSCSGRGRRKHHKTIGIVHLKVYAFTVSLIFWGFE